MAQLEVMNHLRGHRRDRLQFDEPLVAQLADERLELEEELKARSAALGGCLQRLNDRDRSLVRLYYDEELTIPQISEKANRPANTLYKALERVRRALAGASMRSWPRRAGHESR